MKHLGRRGLLGIALALILVAASNLLTSFRLNFTTSLPFGIYRLSAPTGAPKPGDMVALCLPVDLAVHGLEGGYLHPGFCPGHSSHVLKLIAGIPGDTYQITANGIRVNNRLLPGTEPAAHDRYGNQLKSVALTPTIVPAGTLLLYTTNPASWDGRYYGAISYSDLHAAQPLWTRDP